MELAEICITSVEPPGSATIVLVILLPKYDSGVLKLHRHARYVLAKFSHCLPFEPVRFPELVSLRSILILSPHLRLGFCQAFVTCLYFPSTAVFYANPVINHSNKTRLQRCTLRCRSTLKI
jgi:hypothetical protein